MLNATGEFFRPRDEWRRQPHVATRFSAGDSPSSPSASNSSVMPCSRGQQPPRLLRPASFGLDTHCT
ncbi:unnamed protein product [Urochloa humidicola]